MMKKKTENKFAPLKQLVILPLLAVLVMGLSNKEVKTEIKQAEKQTEITLGSEANLFKVIIDGQEIPSSKFTSKKVDFTRANHFNGKIITDIIKAVNINYSDIKISVSSIDSENPYVYIRTKNYITGNNSEFEEKTTIPKPTYSRSKDNNSNTTRRFSTIDEKSGSMNIFFNWNNEKKSKTVDYLSSKTHNQILKGKDIIDKEGIEYENNNKSKSVKNNFVPTSGYKLSDTIKPPRVVKILEIDNENFENALYIVDGEEVENLEHIEPGNVENVNVLKGEEAIDLYGEKGKNGVVVVQTKSAKNSDSGYSTKIEMESKSQKRDDNKIEVMPQFPGGETALKKYIDNSIVYPKRALEKGIIGTVYVEFVISKSGKVKDAKIARGVDPDLNKEALRVVNTLPLWKPGRENGKPVDVTYTVPVEFNIKWAPSKIKNAAGELIVPKSLYIIDGAEYEEMPENIDSDDIKSIDVLKGESGTKYYGEKGKDGVIVIHTKNNVEKSLQGRIDNSKLKSSENLERMSLKSPEGGTPPLFILDGKEVATIDDISPEAIERIEVLKDKSASELYGKRGENGVLVITTKKHAEKNKITTELELRKFIAKNIKYPKEAVETNTDGTTSFLIRVDNNGNIFDIMKPGRADIGLETVVVTAEKTKKPGRYIKNKNQSLLTNEVKRVIEKTPKIQIPEFKGKTVQVSVKFVLQ